MPDGKGIRGLFSKYHTCFICNGIFILFCLVPGQKTIARDIPDTIRVISHNREYITTDPSTGTNSYSKWTVFPGKEISYRKVLLQVTFECPDKLMCAEWDYLDRIYIRRTGGLKGDSANLEIARMLTPYGRRFTAEWKFSWQVDVTDFSSFLHDSTEIEYVHTGYEPCNDRGWRISLEFICIQGESVMDFRGIEKVYEGNFLYGDSSRSIAADLVPFQLRCLDGASVGRFRILQTGHGMDEKEGCAEFCPKWRTIRWDRQVVDQKLIWKECASNPLYPQAGTWIFDRANWCPGELNVPDVYNFSFDSSENHQLEVEMEPYIAHNPSARYAITAYFFQFGKARNRRDASLEKIIVPTDEQVFSRLNPSAGPAVVEVVNSGSLPVLKMRIEYGYTGGKKMHYSWSGMIGFLENEIIELPPVPVPENPATFYAKIKSVNHFWDQYPADNKLQTRVPALPHWPGNLIFSLRTNREAEQTSGFLQDASGNTVFMHLPGSLDSLQEYRDTVHLDPGCYQYVLADTAGDGLEFWYNSTAGKGAARVLDGDGKLIKNFNPDFGNSTGTWFRVTDKPVAVIDTTPVLEIFPIRTTGRFSLEVFFNETQPIVQVQLIHPDGSVAMNKFFYEVKEGLLPLDMRERPDAIYSVKIITRNSDYLRRVKIAR
ncbi:MAG: peptide-N-glycosidase F-related protein [Bacteroidales bacterium]